MANLKRTLCFWFLASLATDAFTQQCNPEDIWAHHDCTKYYICDNGNEVVMSCAPPLYFNPTIDQCDFQENVPECVGGTRPPEGGTTPSTPPTEETTTTPPPTDETSTTPTEEPTSSPTTTPPPTTTEGLPVILTECGETAHGNSGSILYRMEQPYDNNELCTFIIHNDFSGITFTLNSHGFNSSALNAINIFTFSKEGHLETAHLGPPNPLNQVYVSGSLAVVVFRPGRTGYGATGFDLSFEGVGSNSYFQGNHQVFNVTRDVSGNVTLPTQNADEARGTLNVYAIVQNHKVVEPSFYSMKLRISDAKLYVCGDVMQCECESIRVYSFTEGRLNDEVLFCDERYHRSSFVTMGMYIVVLSVSDDPYATQAQLTWMSDGP